MIIKLNKYSVNNIINIVFGLIVLVIGLIQIPKYFSGITPAENSQALSVPANPNLGYIQIALAAINTLLVTVALTQFTIRWIKPVAIIILIVIFITEVEMAIGYSGV